jgi:hypothetical protein
MGVVKVASEYREGVGVIRPVGHFSKSRSAAVAKAAKAHLPPT